jgi:tetratricopeptide (TPR) repeat protein
MKKKLRTAVAMLLLHLAILPTTAFTQLTTAPEGGNRKALVKENIGITDVSIEYSRPGVKGRDGKIWGGLIHTGYMDLGFGTSKKAPWRAGANENTVIEFTTPVLVEGKPLPAGKYALFIAYDANQSTLIFSKNYTSWGSFFYKEEEDALRVPVKNVPLDKSVEWLKFEFLHQTDSSATIALQWEKLMIPFTITTDYINLQIASFRQELRSEKSFSGGWQNWNQAAAWAMQHNTNLEEALTWAETAINDQFVGQKNFATLSTKAQLLTRLNRQAEATAIMKEALPMGATNQIHAYARQLLQQKRGQEAYEVFKLNYDKTPNVFTTNMGMMRGYSAIGNYKKALEFAQKAAPQAPDKVNKDQIERLIKQLQEGKNVNQ